MISPLDRVDGPGDIPALARRGLGYLGAQVMQSPVADPIAFRLTRRAVQRRMDEEADLEDVLDTVLDVRPGYGHYVLEAKQLREELRGAAEAAAKEEPRTVMEIGTSNGGTLYTWCRHLETATRVVSLDLPGGPYGEGYKARGQEIFQDFAGDKDLVCVRADSHEPATYDRIQEVLDGEPIDFLFIDGDHTYEGAKQDFEMYTDLVADDGLVALHDIAHHPGSAEVAEKRRGETDAEDRHLWWTPAHATCNVDELWEEIADEHETRRLVSHPDQTWGGIGLVHL